MEHITGKNRNQVKFICLEELVAEDSAARQIDKLVDEVETSYFEKSEYKGTGRRPYNPKDMLKLYVYGYENGIQSSRKLERESRRNVEVMWLMNDLRPDDKTICNFRKENAEQLKRFFDGYCLKLANEGYIDGKITPIDGTKVRANNSKKNNFSARNLDKHIEYINKKLTEYMSELDKNDKIEELEARKAKYEGFKKRIESGEVTEVSTVDADSRLMQQGNKGFNVSYNVQAAVDSKNKLVAGVLVINEPNDQGQLHKVAKAVKDNLKLREMTVPADKGYYDIDDIKACHEDNITTIVAKPKDCNSGEEIYKKDRFTYDKEKDCYYCPAEQALSFSSEDKDTGIRRYENIKACKGCPNKAQCTKGKRRVISRHKYTEHAEQNDREYAENPDIYKLRQELCEHPFGTVKRTMGIRQFLLRGLTNVTAEAALIFLVYNLKRMRVIHKKSTKKDGEPYKSVRLLAILSLFVLFNNLNRNSNKISY